MIKMSNLRNHQQKQQRNTTKSSRNGGGSGSNAKADYRCSKLRSNINNHSIAHGRNVERLQLFEYMLSHRLM